MYNSLPFARLPRRVIIELVKYAVFWLNSFPHPKGVSKTASPCEIVTGRTIGFKQHCRFEFGEYVQTHEEHDNGMGSRTIGALALRPTGNSQGNFYFYSLSTGRVVSRTHATKLPMPDDVIAAVNRLARRQKMDRGIFMANGEGKIQDDDDSDSAASKT